ncbi:MAG: matrixin family metalloprotease [Candidatus Spechtbacterales bacterium]
MKKLWPTLFLFLFTLQACFGPTTDATTPKSSSVKTTSTSTTSLVQEDVKEVDDLFFADNEVRIWIDLKYSIHMQGILDMLNNEQGWSRVGLTFISEEDRGLADIIIIPREKWSEVERFCAGKKNVAGCAGQYVTIGGDYTCTIQVKAPGETLREEGYLSIVNHEIGHCLGVKHSEVRGELMYESLSYRAMKEIIYPTEEDIKKSKEFFEILKTKTAR